MRTPTQLAYGISHQLIENKNMSFCLNGCGQLSSEVAFSNCLYLNS